MRSRILNSVGFGTHSSHLSAVVLDFLRYFFREDRQIAIWVQRNQYRCADLRENQTLLLVAFLDVVEDDFFAEVMKSE